MTKKIALYIEGKNEGEADLSKPQPLINLVEKIKLTNQGSFEYDIFLQKAVPAAKKTKNIGPDKSGFLTRVLDCAADAYTKDFHAFIFLGDNDGSDNKAKDVNKAQDECSRRALPICAATTAVETFDAWVLYDFESISKVLGDNAKQPPSPHSLTGKQGSGRHPKDVCKNLISTSGKTLSLTEFYEQVFKSVNINFLSTSIPNNAFRDFMTQIQKF